MCSFSRNANANASLIFAHSMSNHQLSERVTENYPVISIEWLRP